MLGFYFKLNSNTECRISCFDSIVQVMSTAITEWLLAYRGDHVQSIEHFLVHCLNDFVTDKNTQVGHEYSHTLNRLYASSTYRNKRAFTHYIGCMHHLHIEINKHTFNYFKPTNSWIFCSLGDNEMFRMRVPDTGQQFRSVSQVSLQNRSLIKWFWPNSQFRPRGATNNFRSMA